VSFSYGYIRSELSDTTSQAAEIGALVSGRTQLAALSLQCSSYLLTVETQHMRTVLHAWPHLAASLNFRLVRQRRGDRSALRRGKCRPIDHARRVAVTRYCRPQPLPPWPAALADGPYLPV